MNIMANKAMQSSMPIIRPMWMLNPKSQLSLSIDDQFFVGDTVCHFLSSIEIIDNLLIWY